MNSFELYEWKNGPEGRVLLGGSVFFCFFFFPYNNFSTTKLLLVNMSKENKLSVTAHVYNEVKGS